MYRKDLTGMRFDRLTVTGYSHFDKYHYWHCVCDCGAERDVIGFYLTSGNTRSCGCLRKDNYRKWDESRVRKYQGKYDKSGHSRVYTAWKAMIHRCYNPKMDDYPRYGGRGITVCDEWKENFQAFHDWAVENGYSDDLTLDRIDPNENYCPENCRWADLETQNNNRRDNVFIWYGGERLTIAQWARKLGVPVGTLYQRRRRGWSNFEVIRGRKY